MMLKKTSVRICFCAAAAVLMTGVSLLCVFCSGGRIGASAVIMTDLIVLLGLLPVILAVGLRVSLRRTLYSYSNPGYIGGILFTSLLFFEVLFRTLSLIGTGEELSPALIFGMITEFPWHFSNVAIPVMFAVCLALGISNIALIRHEGFRPANLLSVLLAAFYIGGTAAIYAFSLLMEANLAARLPQAVFTLLNTYVPLYLLLMMCYFECILVGCGVMGYAASRHVPAYDKDFIIILGCSIDKKGGLLPLLKGRADRAVRFAWEQEIATGKPCRFVPSGGQGPDEVISEGSAMELYLLSHGAEPDEVFPEKKSSNTYENMLFSKRLIDGIQPGARIAYATTNYHVFRSGILARMAGLETEGIASKTKWYFWPNGFIREFFGILAVKKRAHAAAAVALGLICAALAAACLMGTV